ncbi:MAG: hypothetical protein LBF09_07680 [Odoribacteraceae bacterium]|jgi:hypothetical protein|nr:hypothetical protein [Odoribacteraceae bacterium]
MTRTSIPLTPALAAGNAPVNATTGASSRPLLSGVKGFPASLATAAGDCNRGEAATNASSRPLLPGGKGLSPSLATTAGGCNRKEANDAKLRAPSPGSATRVPVPHACLPARARGRVLPRETGTHPFVAGKNTARGRSARPVPSACHVSNTAHSAATGSPARTP